MDREHFFQLTLATRLTSALNTGARLDDDALRALVVECVHTARVLADAVENIELDGGYDETSGEEA